MIELAQSDFVSLEEFPLAWRFAPERVGEASSNWLSRVRPLGQSRAADAALFARDSCGASREFTITLRSDDSPLVVQAALNALPPAPATRIVLSWDSRTAVATEWEVFVAHWGVFCYPASDDVTIMPLDGDWCLCYRHYEIFQFSAAR